MNDTIKNQINAEELTAQWWFVYSDEVDTIEKLNLLDMDDVFHLIRVIYVGYSPIIISDWKIESGDLWITFAKEE